MVGRGFVEPVDDFNDQNPPSHPEELDFLADEFVSQGYDLRNLARIICHTEAYQRGRLTGVEYEEREEAEAAFASAPMRRMLAESLFDSIVQAGHLFEQKWAPGSNLKTVRQLVRISIPREGEAPLAGLDGKAPAMAKPQMVKVEGAYDLESAIEVDFAAALKGDDEDLALDKMAVMSKEEIEAMQTCATGLQPADALCRALPDVQIDDNPRFASARADGLAGRPGAWNLRPAGPRRPGRHRDHTPSMRQRHDAQRQADARGGPGRQFEPMNSLLEGEQPRVDRPCVWPTARF